MEWLEVSTEAARDCTKGKSGARDIAVVCSLDVHTVEYATTFSCNAWLHALLYYTASCTSLIHATHTAWSNTRGPLSAKLDGEGFHGCHCTEHTRRNKSVNCSIRKIKCYCLEYKPQHGRLKVGILVSMHNRHTLVASSPLSDLSESLPFALDILGIIE